MTAGVTWDTIFGGNPDDVFKGQFGFVLVRDYDPTKPLASWTPFASDGNWSSTLLTTDGFSAVGYLDESALEFSTTTQTADTKAWQARQKLMTDITDDEEMASFNAIQRNPIIEALESHLALASMGVTSQAGYQYTKPKSAATVYRQWVYGAVYNSAYGLEGWARCYAKGAVIKPDKLTMNPKVEAGSKLQVEAFPDALAGYAVRTFRDGPGWRARGGTAGTPGTPVATAGTAGSGLATLTFTAPTTGVAPFTYNVFLDASVTALSAATITVGGTTANPILTVSGLTTGAHTFKVQAVAANLSASAQTAASNSVTLT